MESYPTTISNPPSIIANARVLAWAEVQHIPGNYPGGIVLAYDANDAFHYRTWDAYTKDGGETWDAFSGHYTPDHDVAWRNFISRCTNLSDGKANDLSSAYASS